MTQLESLADAPGKSREYETIFILTPDTPNEGVAKINDRIKGVVEGQGGMVLKVDNWGKRKLAYEVSKQLKGIYLYWQYLGTCGLVAELERNLRMLDPVIRYMTVKLDADIDPTARPTEMDDDAYARAAETAADEEDLVMGAGESDEESDSGSDADSDEGAADAEGQALAADAGDDDDATTTDNSDAPATEAAAAETKDEE